MTNIEKYEKMGVEELIKHTIIADAVGDLCLIKRLEGENCITLEQCNEWMERYCTEMTNSPDPCRHCSHEISPCCARCFHEWLNKECEK